MNGAARAALRSSLSPASVRRSPMIRAVVTANELNALSHVSLSARPDATVRAKRAALDR